MHFAFRPGKQEGQKSKHRNLLPENLMGVNARRPYLELRSTHQSLQKPVYELCASPQHQCIYL